MAEDDLPPADAVLKKIFEPQHWTIYEKRAGLLSSADPEDWERIDFPIEVAVELTNHCNLRCVMCPVPNLKRTRGFMKESLFNKIVASLSGESGFIFLPQGFGESLLHAKWLRLIDSARVAKIRPIIILTNGMLLGADRIKSLTSGVDVVVVTIDGATAETYESVRVGGRFDSVTRNIENLLEMRGDAGLPHVILRMIRMKDNQEEIEAFISRWSGKIGGDDIIQVSDCIDWAGNVPYRGVDEINAEEQTHPCRMLWKNLTVYHDGRVSPCCYDAEGELIVGDARRQNLREIWSGGPLRGIRSLHLSGRSDTLAICSRCRNRQ